MCSGAVLGSPYFDPNGVALVVITLVIFAAELVAYAGTYELEARRSYRTALVAGWVEFILALTLTVMGIVLAFVATRGIAAGGTQDTIVAALVAFVCLAVGGCGLTASLKTLFALKQPEVRRRFR
jgi:hypothetical protein